MIMCFLLSTMGMGDPPRCVSLGSDLPCAVGFLECSHALVFHIWQVEGGILRFLYTKVAELYCSNGVIYYVEVLLRLFNLPAVGY